jgi:hypothetical protein
MGSGSLWWWRYTHKDGVLCSLVEEREEEVKEEVEDAFIEERYWAG